jgi:hypothetical protein
MPDLPLLPVPRHLVMRDGTFALCDHRLILLDSATPHALRFAAARLQHTLREQFGLTWQVVASTATPRDQIALTLRVATDAPIRAQGYELSITSDGITINAHDNAGIFYGTCTLIQLLDQPNHPTTQPPNHPTTQLPCLHISDSPDFPARGIMLDISRDKVPTLETLRELVDLLAGWKINQLQLYTEHTFAYRNHPEVWANASPMTGEEILDLDAYCRERHIELVPNQNSFGHLARWLTHPRYLPLAEAPDGFNTPWGYREGPFSLCPIDPRSIELIRSLYDELLPHFTSRLFNVGCDETWDLGQGRSKEECERRGAGRVYLDFLLKIHREVQARGRTMQFWGDIITQHPELIPELPKDIIALEWGYEADHPFDEHGAAFAAAGIPFYVCPGTSSWCSIAGRTDNALGNLRSAAENGLKHGSIGYLNTDWGDYGHWQMLPISYLGLAMGAAYAWSFDANRALDVPRAVSWHAFRDPTGAMGRVAYDLGNVYKAVGVEPHNSSLLFKIMQWSLNEIRDYAGVSPDAFHHALEAIDTAMQPLANARMACADAGLIAQEFALTARLLRHACRRALFAFNSNGAMRRELDNDMQQFIADYGQVWRARNRPGGLSDSVARLEKVREAYREVQSANHANLRE